MSAYETCIPLCKFLKVSLCPPACVCLSLVVSLQLRVLCRETLPRVEEGSIHSPATLANITNNQLRRQDKTSYWSCAQTVVERREKGTFLLPSGNSLFNGRNKVHPESEEGAQTGVRPRDKAQPLGRGRADTQMGQGHLL